MMRRNPVVWACLVLALSLVLAGSVAPFARAGRVAPDCTLRDVSDSKTYALRQYHGKVIWLDFWASWCGTCAESLPFLNDLDREFRARGLQVLGINLDEDPREALAFMAKNPATFTQAADAQGDCPRSFGVEAMPSSYLIDRQGMIRHVHLGFQPGETDRLRALVNQILAEEVESSPAPVGGGHENARDK